MRWTSLGVLVAASVLLALFWGDVPDRWITHWAANGRPDGWATKSFVSATVPLVIGLGVWILFELMALWIANSGKTTGAPREMMAVQATVVRAVGLALSLLMAGLTLALPLLHPRSPFPIVVAAVSDTGLVIVIAAVWARHRMRRLRESGVALPAGYGAFLYNNPRDSRLWVPKFAGIGWTINFAHRRAWPVMIALVGLPIALVLLISLAAR